MVINHLWPSNRQFGVIEESFYLGESRLSKILSFTLWSLFVEYFEKGFTICHHNNGSISKKD